MHEDNNPDIYLCALLTEMVTAREGDVSHEFQTVVRLMQRLRDYTEEETLILIQSALAMEQEHDFDTRIALCKENLDDERLREALGLLAYLARIDGAVSNAEEGVFARVCVGLGVTLTGGKVEITR